MTTEHETTEATEIVAPERMDTLGTMVASEIAQQIATARTYPREVSQFINRATSLACLNEDVAAECFYAVPRAGKNIEGPSIRLAEIVANTWGNCRVASRIIDEGDEFVVAQGLFHDLETNTAITSEVRRRITTKNGTRFGPDMINVTANAAASIAMRNAVFKGIPKAFWVSIYQDARRCAIGDIKTLANKRADAIEFLQKYGVNEERLFAALEVGSVEEITLEHLATLKGAVQAIKSGEVSPEEMFPEPTEHEKNRSNLRNFAANGSANNGDEDPPESSPTINDDDIPE